MSALNEGDRGILKRCKWKGMHVPCSGIFTTFPTDRGMCCSFNMKAADEIFVNSLYTTLVKQNQAEDYNTSFENSTLPLNYTSRNEPRTQAGRSMGLEVVIDAHSDVVESFSITHDFEGFTGLISEPGRFPLTNVKGFEIKPGHINLVAISAVQIHADDNLQKLNPDARQCLYQDEIGNLTLFKNYSQSNCILECSVKYAQKEFATTSNLSCTFWFFPFANGSSTICDPFQSLEVSKLLQNVPNDECNYCLPDCIRTIYDQKVTTQPFRQCDERNLGLTDFCTVEVKPSIRPQLWAREVIEGFVKKGGKIPDYLSGIVSGKRTIKNSYVLQDFFPGLLKEYDAFVKDIAVIKVFFDSSTVMQFRSKPSQTWTDYFSSVGGALGLCIGLSIMTVIEIVWLICRMGGFCKKRKNSGLSNVRKFPKN
jgi:hypothetical protein